MILAIPSIELKEGLCTQCIIGEQGTEELYRRFSSDPLSLCRLWRRENARTIHIIDSDSFDQEESYVNKNAVIYISQELDIPIQFYANFKKVDECRMFLDNGLFRLAIGELMFTDPEGVRQLIEDYTPSRVAFAIQASDGFEEFPTLSRRVSIFEFLSQIREVGGDRIIYHEKQWSGLRGIDFERLTSFAISTDIKITLDRGVRNAEDLWKLNSMSRFGVDSVILGHTLYQNAFPCQKIWREIEAKLEK
ncbi:MAG: HisA/HisF-related TIM barrel protein [Bacteroidota bacterium]